jgi:choline dehydrogenase-like flavoprotein
MELPAKERETLRLLADAIVPRTEGPLAASASDLGVDALAAQAIAGLPAAAQAQFRQLLRVVESSAFNLLLTGRPTRFSRLDSEAREAYLRSWSRSRLAVKRRAFHAVKRLAAFLYYTALPDGRANPVWPTIGYRAPDDAERARHGARPELRIRPMEVTEDVLETDLAVVGSGAGGSVIAAHAAKAGFRVLVIEAGPLLTADTFTQRELPGTDGMLERHGLMTSKDLAFGVLHGRTAGGGTAVNWMTCLKPPRFALEEWERVYGIPGLTGPEFAAHVDEVWARLGVTKDESVLTTPSRILKRGCEALGYRMGVDFDVTAKNARGCANRCDYCNFGCVYGGKQSTLVTYLVDAYRNGTQFLFDAEVSEVMPRGWDSEFLLTAFEGTEARAAELEIRAKVVVLAAGALRTPAILLRSGIREPNVGRGLRFDPTTAAGGVYEEPVEMWRGVPQTLHVDRFLRRNGDYGFWLESVPAHPGLTAIGIPWRGGRAHKEAMLRYRHTFANILLVRDTSSGRVTIDREGHPVAEYVMNARDKANMVEAIVESGRIHVAAGARSVFSLHHAAGGIPYRKGPIRPSEFDAFEAEVRRLGVEPNTLALFSAHAMGSVPMGASDRMPTKPTGELRAAPNVFIGDGSVLPTPPGVNPMITIMAMARRTADFVVEALRRSR